MQEADITIRVGANRRTWLGLLKLESLEEERGRNALKVPAPAAQSTLRRGGLEAERQSEDNWHGSSDHFLSLAKKAL